MVWVKGELLTSLDAANLDPTAQLSREAQPILYDRIDWFRRLANHASAKTTPLIARAASDGKLVWLMLQYVGNCRFEALANWYTTGFRPVFAGNPDDARKLIMLTAIAKRIRAMRDSPQQITLSPVPREDGTSTLLAQAFKRAGWLVFANQTSTSWKARVSGLSFDEYWAARPGQLRSTFKRKNSKADFNVIIYDQFDETAWEEFEAVYADSWKPEEGAPAFLRETAVFEGAAGCLRLGVCRLEGVAVAAQYWTVEGGTAYIHKLAHRESARELSPGTILSRALFQHVIDQDAVDVIDFGTGDEPYKADWMDASTPLDRIDAYNPRRASGLIGAARALISVLVARARGR
ncbi:MAG: GNAT family N-acetyltransferase [Pseudomonadota bacterium]